MMSIDVTTYSGRNALRVEASERYTYGVKPRVVLALLDRLDELDPPPQVLKAEDDPAFHFCRVTNDLADLQTNMCEAMDRLTRLAESTGQTTRAFFADGKRKAE